MIEMEMIEQGIEVNLRGQDYFLVNNVDKEEIESWHRAKAPDYWKKPLTLFNL